MNFRNASLNEICTIHYGKDHKRLDEGAFPVYGSGGIIRHVNRFLYDKPSVLIPRKGTLSNLFYVDKPFWTVDTIFWTAIDEKKINPKFLYYSLLTKHLDELNIGSAVPSLSTEVLNKIVISVPPIPIQDKIVSELSSFDCKIESNNKINDNLSKPSKVPNSHSIVVEAKNRARKQAYYFESCLRQFGYISDQVLPLFFGNRFLRECSLLL